MVGKYIALHDAYKSIYEAFSHAGIANHCKVTIRKVSAEDVLTRGVEVLEGVHGLMVPGGFGERGVEGKIRAIQWARETGVPFFGICLGMQCAVIEYARNVLGLSEAHTLEHSEETPDPVICLMSDQEDVEDKGGTMRLGAYDCRLSKKTLAHRLYGEKKISERHRHRFEFNNDYTERFEKGGMALSGKNPDRNLVEIVEIADHPFFIGVQFHPEFKSRPLRPHPVFDGFIAAALQRSRGNNTSRVRQESHA